MSAFFGVCSLDRQGLAPHWHDAAKSDVVLHRKGHVLLTQRAGRRSGASRPSRPSTALLLACDARLDDRAHLARQLGLSADEASDADLILAAYEQWGADGVEQLSGDWAFALWDTHRHRLLLARDATGQSSLYWWRSAGVVAFASDLRTLVSRLPERVRPAAGWAANMMAVFDGVAGPFDAPYEGVNTLPDGASVLIQEDRELRRRWWRPLELPLLPPDDIQAYREEVIRLYAVAVAERMGGAADRVGLTLSGGLDSGSVAALAAPVAAARGQLIRGYVHVPGLSVEGLSQARVGDEGPLAAQTADHVGHISLQSCSCQSVSALEGMRKLVELDLLPSQAAANMHWVLDILARARDDGVSILLTGQGGNSTVSYKSDGNLWPHLLAGQWGHAMACLRSDHAGFAGALMHRVAKPPVRLLRARLRRFRAEHAGNAPWAAYAGINPVFARELRLLERMHEADHDPSYQYPAHDWERRFRLALVPSTMGMGATWGGFADRFDMTIADPTRARKLVEFCSRLPDEAFWAGGVNRGLIRVGMAGRLPPAVLHSARKGRQAADLQARLQAHRDELLNEVEAVSRHELVRAWIDTPRLRASAMAASAPASDTSKTVDNELLSPVHVLRHLGLAMHLAKH